MKLIVLNFMALCIACSFVFAHARLNPEVRKLSQGSVEVESDLKFSHDNDEDVDPSFKSHENVKIFYANARSGIERENHSKQGNSPGIINLILTLVIASLLAALLS